MLLIYLFIAFQKFAQNFLQWEEVYSFQKLLPMLTRWQCMNYQLLHSKGDLKGILYPERIKKVRNPKGKGQSTYIFFETFPKSNFVQ